LCIQIRKMNPNNMSEKSEEEWFASWFDSEFYHILYGQRDENEATGFISSLVSELKLTAGMHILDLACGKGRHTRVFHRSGFNAFGVDLSPESIAYAKMNSAEEIRFDVADMRNFRLNETFDVVANLFTSFGYFDSMEENLQVLNQVKKHLKPEGVFILDFFNATCVKNDLVLEETIIREGINFHIRRSIQGDHIVKAIDFEAEGKEFHFEERVQALGLSNMKALLKNARFTLDHVFGSYKLEEFNEQNSARLILICSHE